MPNKHVELNPETGRFERSFTTGQGLEFELRAIRRQLGINLINYSRAVHFDVIVGERRKKLIAIRLKPTTMDPYKLIPATLSVPQEFDGVDGQIFAALHCYFLARCEKVVKISDKGFEFKPYDTYKYNPEEHYFKIRARLIQGARCIPVNITSDTPDVVLRKEMRLHAPRPPPDYLEELYVLYKNRVGDSRPLEAFKKARITGGSFDGVADALGNLARNETHPDGDPRLIITAVGIAQRLGGWSRDKLLTLDYSEGCYYKLGCPSKTSGGLVPTHEQVINGIPGIQVKYTGQLPKEDQLFDVSCELHKIDAELDRRFDRNELWYDETLYPPLFTIPEIKLSVRDDDKERIFFMNPTWNYLLEKHIMGPIINYMKGRGWNAIGVKWGEGDAQRIYNEFGDFKKFIESDMTSQDISELAQILMFIYASHILWFSKTDRRSYFKTWHHMHRLINAVIINILQWPDGFWRVIIGMNMSGKYSTTHINTFFSIVAFIYYLLWTAKNYGAHKEALYRSIRYVQLAMRETDPDKVTELLKRAEAAAKFNGDDSIIAAKGSLTNVITLATIRNVLQSHFKVTIKWKNCNETTSMLSMFEYQHGTIIRQTWVDPEGGVHQKAHGVVFLKHYFVQREYDPLQPGVNIVVPVRDAREHWFRDGRAVSNVHDRAIALARIHGLMLGSLGTNAGLYNFHYKMADYLIEIDKEFISGKRKDPTDAEGVPVETRLYMGYKVVEDDIEMQELLNKSRHLGVLSNEVVDFKTRPRFDKMEAQIWEASYRMMRRGIAYGALLRVPSLPLANKVEEIPFDLSQLDLSV